MNKKASGPQGPSRRELRKVDLGLSVGLSPSPPPRCPQPRPSSLALHRFAARADCGCSYHLRVKLTSADYIVLASYEPPPVTIPQWSDAAWTEVRLQLLTPPRLLLPGPGLPRASGLEPFHITGFPASRSPTPSPTTHPASAISSSSTEARTPSSGQAGMGPASPTAASPSAINPRIQSLLWLSQRHCPGHGRRQPGRPPRLATTEPEDSFPPDSTCPSPAQLSQRAAAGAS